MKVGTFVGQEHIRITDTERKAILERVRAILKECFPDQTPKITYKSNMDSLNCLVITAENAVPSGTFRTMKGEDWFVRSGDVIAPNGTIQIILYSEMGYDEAEVGKFYEWEKMGHPKDWRPEYDKHSYSLSFLWNGIHRGYRKQHTSGLGLKGSYHYGTELSDLTFEDNFRMVAKIMSYAKPMKEKLKSR